MFLSEQFTVGWMHLILQGVPTLVKFCDKLKDILARYPNIKVVDGCRLVPHLPEYFLDNLHPNQLGTEVYGRNLVEKKVVIPNNEITTLRIIKLFV